MTSFDVVAYLRGVFKTKKIGHTGTLDPAASGVLPVCIGNATKAIEYITEKDKYYRAELTLGIETDTQDSTGTVTGVKAPNISIEQILNVVNTFKGKYDQIPPMYSAIKVDGKKLYELARQGKTVERKPREVEIYSLEVLGVLTNETFEQAPVVKVMMDVKCSKGTYIRTLCADIGERIGCGGIMSFLIRMGTGSFQIADSFTFEEIKMMVNENKTEKLFIDMGNVFGDLCRIDLKTEEEKKFANGVPIKMHTQNNETQLVRIYSPDGRFLALGGISLIDGQYILKSKKFFL